MRCAAELINAKARGTKLGRDAFETFRFRNVRRLDVERRRHFEGFRGGFTAHLGRRFRLVFPAFSSD
jgi:hypothetical protein